MHHLHKTDDYKQTGAIPAMWKQAMLGVYAPWMKTVEEFKKEA